VKTWIAAVFLIAVSFAAGFFYGGWAEQAQPPAPKVQPTADDPLPSGTFTVRAREISNLPISLVGKTTWDLDEDGIDEGIELYVDAAREKGQFIWDDGQRWLFIVRDSDKVYPLYDDMLPLGVVEFWVFSSEPQLVFKVDGGVRLAMYTVDYDADEGEYVVSTALRAENLRHRTVIH
jgi:hypothetical protein